MKIDVSLIEGYADLTAEEKVKILEEFDMEEKKDEETVKELEKARKSVTRANSEAADWKRKYKALEEQNKGEKDANETALEQLQAELKQIQKEKKESEHKANFLALGYDEELATEAAKALIDGDMTAFFECQKKHNVNYKKTIEKEAVVNMSTPKGGGQANNYDKLTKEEFRKLDYAERRQLKKEQPEIFYKLNQ